jgi:hypothetical protein
LGASTGGLGAGTGGLGRVLSPAAVAKAGTTRTNKTEIRADNFMVRATKWEKCLTMEQCYHTFMAVIRSGVKPEIFCCAPNGG